MKTLLQSIYSLDIATFQGLWKFSLLAIYGDNELRKKKILSGLGRISTPTQASASEASSSQFLYENSTPKNNQEQQN